jgi:hypothetical protein
LPRVWSGSAGACFYTLAPVLQYTPSPSARLGLDGLAWPAVAGHASASLGNALGSLNYWLALDHLDNQSHPQTFGAAAVKTGDAAAAGSFTVVNSADIYRDIDSAGKPRIVVSSTGIDHTVQDMAKLKLAYKFTPGLSASYTLGLWQNATTRCCSSGPTSFLRCGIPTKEYGLKNWHPETLAVGSLLVGLFGLLASVTAAPPRVEAFDAAAWSALQAGLKQPTGLGFSTTDCRHCPAVLRQLAQQMAQHQGRDAKKFKASLVAVVMAAAPGDDDSALLADADYRLADRLLAFSGRAPALRQAVDLRWHSVTPFAVFLSPQATPVFVTGPPKAAQVGARLRPPLTAAPR